MFYRQSIIAFGFALPAVLCAVVVGGGILLKSNSEASFQQKQALYKASEQSRAGSQSIEKEISQKRAFVEHWNAQMGRETANSIASTLKEIGDKLPSKEFQQTAVEYPPGAVGIAAGSAQSSSQVRLAFRATYRSMQRAFIELETLMPQLQLNELKVDPSTSSNSTMNFSATYTAWQK